MLNLFSRRQQKGVTMEEAVVQARQDQNVRLVDVRSPAEYRQGHLPGSLSVPLDQWESITDAVSDKAAVLYIYCLSGARSQAACRAFGQLGYAQVTNIGGIAGYSGPLER